MSFSEQTILQVWQKGKIVAGYDPDKFRKDKCDAWIAKEQYGNRNHNLGWEIDHIISPSNGGSDNISNLRPLQWENNVAKKEGRLDCRVTSHGNNNIHVG